MTTQNDDIGQVCRECGSGLMMVKLQGGTYGVVCSSCLFRNARAAEYQAGENTVTLRLHIEPPEIKRVVLKINEVGS